MDRRSYEFFAGPDASGQPTWTKQIRQRKPVLENPGHVGFAVRVTYLPGIRRYLLTTFTQMDGSWAVYDAPHPWGPWTTAATFVRWIDDVPKFGFTFPAKWMSDDGTTLYMVFSGTRKYDAFNVVRGMITLRR
jgi:hypothetical protein